MDCSPPGSSVHGDSPGKNTGVGSLSLLQGIFPTQGSNPDLLHCRQILYCLSHKGSPRILECVAYHFSRGSSQPRNQTGISCIAGRFFTSWATREAFPETSTQENIVILYWGIEMDFKNLKNNFQAFQTAASIYIVGRVNLYLYNFKCIFILSKLIDLWGV